MGGIRTVAVTAVIAMMGAGAGQAQDGPRAPGLFDTDGVLNLRLVTNLRDLMEDRDSLKAASHPGKLSYVDAAGAMVTVDVDLRLRGHWRRQKKNCDFAPIKVDFPKAKEQPDGALFARQGNLKLVTHCRSKDQTFEQYVLREYMVYRLYNVLTPASFRVRLTRTTYVDVLGKQDSVTRYAFLLEDEERLADRNKASIVENRGARFEDIEAESAAIMSAFEYLIGGTDWSLVALHNIVLTQNKETGAVVPVPYDFDWSGIVSTKYSFPDYRLPIKTVRDRIYRGICRTPEQWQPVLQRFRDNKAGFYAVYDSLPALDARYVKETRQYLDDFYEVLERPGSVKLELINTCREAGE